MSSWIFANLSKNWGGGERWTLTTAIALRDLGHSVQIITYPQSALAQRAKRANIPYCSFKAHSLSIFNPKTVFCAWRLLRQNTHDAIVLNASHELKFFGLIAKWANVPHILFRRGISQPLRDHFLNHWFLAHVTNGLLLNSYATKRAMESVFASEMAHLPSSVIHNGIDVSQWVRRKSVSSQKIVGVVGRLTEEKGMDRALRVFAQVWEQQRDATLWILGEGKERKALERLASDLEITDHVRFLGFREDVQSVMEDFDVLLFPSYWEGFGFVLLEAMSLAVPPVAFNIEAAQEIIKEGTGILVPDNDLKACARAIVNLLEDGDARKRMGKEAEAHVKACFSLRQGMEQLVSFIEPKLPSEE